ncbi:hypothetical protein LEP1GSC041_1692 [Leptospira noguchii str. 2006001870]|nr:hypothetical protein LEP1GSC041_1692 [Leptospira noguchii str. 2006001870]EMO25233.1 hypothetical protein LEP1GSC170_2633 [Leptospira interrogans serovar Bataviae str. HAI135]
MGTTTLKFFTSNSNRYLKPKVIAVVPTFQSFTVKYRFVRVPAD